MFAIWFFSKSKDIYKDSSTYNQNSTEQRYKSCCLSRRYFNIGFFQTRGSITCKIFDYTIRTAWFFYQQRKIIPKTITSSGLFGIPNKFQDNVDEITSTQNKGSNSGMSKNKGKGVDIYSETCISYRKNFSNSECSLSSMIANKSSIERQECRVEETRMGQHSQTFQRKPNAVGLVDSKFTSLEWKKLDTRGTNDNNIHRRFNLRMGSIPEELCNSWKMVSRRSPSSHQHIRTQSHNVCSTGIQGFKESVSNDSNRQYNMCSVHKPPGWNHVYNNVKNSRGAMDFMFKTKHSHQGRTHPRNTESDCRSGFSDEIGQARLEISSQNVQYSQPDLGTTPDRPVRKSSQYPASEILLLDARSRSRSNKCISSEMEQSESLDKPSMDFDTQDSGKANSRQSNNDNIGFILAFSSMVSTFNETSHSTSDTFSIRKCSPSRSEHTRESFSESSMENTRLQNFRVRYQNKGFSEKSINLLLSTMETSSTKTVSSNLRVWLSWCRTNTVDPIVCNLNHICEFFADMLKEGKSYNTISGYRLAISEVHDHVEGVPIRQHPDISKAILAIFKENPPNFLLNDLMDISPFLSYITSLGDNSLMTIHDLTIKTAF
jgi:hypothetical protein